MSSPRRVGIFGGTFNPPHHGHIVCAQEARIQLELDSVRVVPVGDPPHRELELDPGGNWRVEMVKLAVEGQRGLEVSTVELDREGPSFTVDTLAGFAEGEPDTEFTLILGTDQAMALGSWREPARIGQLARIAIAARAGHDREQAIAEAQRATGGAEPRLFEMPRIDISSSLIRNRIEQGETVAHLVPTGVSELIDREGLYR